jgi:hypothetical protein
MKFDGFWETLECAKGVMMVDYRFFGLFESTFHTFGSKFHSTIMRGYLVRTFDFMILNFRNH